MNCILEPAFLRGSVTPPPSKSLAHRAILCAALADGVSEIGNIAFSEDIKATLRAVRLLGAEVSEQNGGLVIKGAEKKEKSGEIDCGESGSTLRFVVPLALAFGGDFTFRTRGTLNMQKRPMTPYLRYFHEQNIAFSSPDSFTLMARGKLAPGRYLLEGNISSQFLPGLLLALPLLDGDSEIVIEGVLESTGYVDLTLSALCDFGVSVENRDYAFFRIPGRQRYRSCHYTVESDYSQAAFFFAAGAVGGQVVVRGMREDSLQADRKILPILRNMGIEIQKTEEGLCAVRREHFSSVIDASSCPDIIPIAALVAAVTEGTTEIVNAARLRIKECDRLAATVKELNAIGADLEEYPDKMIIHGKKSLTGGEFDSYNDHRMAMTAAIAAACCRNPVFLKDYQSVKKSYPDFFEVYRALGGKMRN